MTGHLDDPHELADMGLATRAIHAGQDPDPRTGSVVPPIHQTSTFAQDGVGRPRQGYEYARTSNPTRDALETCLASLEGAETAVCFASGLAAEDAVLRLLDPGEHVVMPDDVYGGTWRLVSQIHGRYGVEADAVDLTDLDVVRKAIRPTTRMIWAETPSNPLLKLADIAGLAELAHEHGARLVVDNTFATPALQQPLSLGADLVVHSSTKYLGGHSDVVGGAVCTDTSTATDLRFTQNAAGAVPGPFDCWLTLRGIKTLDVRMERHCQNAQRLAEWLEDHPRVAEVLYPGLPSHPGRDLAARQMGDRFGGMVALRVEGGRDAAIHLCESTRLFVLAESLGAVESLIEHPAVMTHASVAGTSLAVPDDLVRLSVGIEVVDDLIADLERALAG